MPRLTLSDLTTLSNEASAVATINSNFADIEAEFEKPLYRDGEATNTLSADIDMNGNDILNLGNITLSGGDSLSAIIDYAEEWANKAPSSLVSAAAGGDQIDDYSAKHFADASSTSATAAASSATAASSSASSASTSATAAASSATSAAASAAAAAAAAGSNLFNTISDKSANYTVVADTDDGTLFKVNTAGGSVALTLPSIATAVEGERYGIYRESASNSLTLIRNGTDTINGVAGTYTVAAVAGELTVIVADDATPDNWIVFTWTQASVDETTITKASGNLAVKSGGLTATYLASDSVTTAKILDSNVTIPKLADTAKPIAFSFEAGWGSAGTGEDLVDEQLYGFIVAPVDCTLTGETGYIVTASAGAAVQVDVELNGTTIYSTKPQFAAAANTLTAGTLSTTAVSAGNRLGFRIKQVGTSTVGQMVGFTLKGKLA